ncbi:MAG: ABC transporter permease subunit [Actinobacteria bacterium]|nr:ABC transporter permease subunit [Actinomycetota bacterium]
MARKDKARVKTSNPLVKVLLVIFMICMAIFILGPLVWLGVHAFVTNWTYPNLTPDGWTLHWWTKVLDDSALEAAIRNSLIISPIVVLCSMVICLPAAYAAGRMNYAGRKTFLIGMFAANSFPKIGLFASIATLYYALNLMGTVFGIIIIQLLGTIIYMTWIPAAAFAAVPRNLEEAARDAGASKFRVFRTITLRMAMPGILVAIVMSFLASFDEAQGTYLVGAPAIFTMPTEMYSLVQNYPIQVAAVFSLLLAIPSVLLISLARKHIVGGQLAEGFQIK